MSDSKEVKDIYESLLSLKESVRGLHERKNHVCVYGGMSLCMDACKYAMCMYVFPCHVYMVYHVCMYVSMNVCTYA
jgi:hypothetical protein